ncbi:serine/arginine-rich SC35-like splicing factor SCL30A [Cucurbita pepo subsp. pepo]|uniref:serine/arginine-rich SC35-like splicing factor SCL30A n=1 Tax=Cucurbita pepo subsp. pepo TaxID=3664 RepID=UPI000C9D6670|nr:serine/arginine-rich SC35-like splicing factor SCL30A [Cucurbita pepo subsp. pepo]XP_023531531.1 serine/arginine-rich SC35-like splicing factor SCL30A [Cucurbita pepo subsp. pepo]
MRGRSYTPSPPRGYGRRGRSPSPRGRYGGGRGRDLPTSLLVRNLRHDCRPEDLRRQFGQFGAIKDVYLPKDYYTGEPRGFGFVQYVDPADAADAKHQMDGCVLQGREITVVFAEENRKKPSDMRARERGSGRFHDRRRSPPRYSRSPPQRHARRSFSPAPCHARSRSRSYDYASPPPRQRAYSRSISPSPRGRRDSRERSYPRQPSRGRSYSRSPQLDGARSRSQSPAPRGGSRSPSPVRGRRLSRSRSRSRSISRSRSPRHSPRHEEEYRSELNGGGRSPSR